VFFNISPSLVFLKSPWIPNEVPTIMYEMMNAKRTIWWQTSNLTQELCMNLLPSRPLEVDTKSLGQSRRKLWPSVLIFCVFGCALLAFAAVLGQDILKERRLWERGVSGEAIDIRGRESQTGKAFLWIYNYDLKVDYLDAKGKKHTGNVKFDYLFSKLKEDATVELRYDSKFPDQIVLSWQTKSGLPRLGFFMLMSLFGIGMLVFIPFTIWKDKRLGSTLQMAAQGGEELWVEVIGMDYVYNVLYMAYKLPETGDKKHKQSLPATPLIVHRDGKDFAIALRLPEDPKRLYFVHDDLGPFVFSAEEKLRMTEMLANYRSAEAAV
jgi:hypothetical protein